MERKHITQNLRQGFSRLGKYKYALLIALIGLGILLLPTGKQEVVEPLTPEVVISDEKADEEERMERILSSVEGAGQVRVMLTTRNNGITEYQTDLDTTQNGTNKNSRTQTVFGGSEGALVKTVSAPEYLGALVVSEGAERKDVQLALVKAICTLTGLGSNRVTVLKMSK